MAYVRWEYHESITVSIDPGDVAAAAPTRLPSVARQLGLPRGALPALPAPSQSETLRWLAPAAVAAGMVIAREVARHEVLPRLTARVRASLLPGRRLPALPKWAPLALAAPAGDEESDSR